MPLINQRPLVKIRGERIGVNGFAVAQAVEHNGVDGFSAADIVIRACAKR